MQNNSLVRRSLVYGIILLLVGLSVTSSIGGYIGKIRSVSVEEVPTSFPMNSDYTHAYWKFDEGGGNTAYDSSGHDFDGTIYGATWTTNTPSGSGYALDFDGVDDYVDLDAHAYDLGFNKTDDLIFSFCFNSTSTDKGIIYGLSHSWGYNPGVHIALNANGTLEFRAWKTNCGVILITDETYNDGSWHYVEIYYNGISSNPTIEIYVDYELNASTTHWICYFYNDMFETTKIGRRSNDSTYLFDGIIDELKVIKYPGGNEQNPPNISGPTGGNPLEELEFTFVTNDPEEDNISLWIDWDDGDIDEIGPYTSGEEVIRGHTWTENGTYNITAKSIDIWDDSSLSPPYPVIIGNVPPDAPTIDGPRCGDPGVEYEYTFVSEDFEGDDVMYYINWDDGTTYETDYYASGQEVTVSHKWNSIGDYEIKAQAIDAYGNKGEWSTYAVRIGDQPPEAPDIDGPKKGIPGVEYTYTFVTTDPEGDDVCYFIDWGDGNTEETTFYASGEEATASHTWDERDTYTIRARARDDSCGFFGDWSEYIFTVPVNYQSSQQSSKPLPLKILSKNTICSQIIARLLGL